MAKAETWRFGSFLLQKAHYRIYRAGVVRAKFEQDRPYWKEELQENRVIFPFRFEFDVTHLLPLNRGRTPAISNQPYNLSLHSVLNSVVHPEIALKVLEKIKSNVIKPAKPEADIASTILEFGKIQRMIEEAEYPVNDNFLDVISNPGINWPKIRLGFVVYGGGSRMDWRKVAIDDVRADPRLVEQQLMPLLRRDLAPDRDSIEKWTERLVRDCRHLLSGLLPLTANEIEFLRLLNDKGLIHPELLTSDEKLQTAITAQPGLQWKALNVRKYRELKMK